MVDVVNEWDVVDVLDVSDTLDMSWIRCTCRTWFVRHVRCYGCVRHFGRVQCVECVRCLDM